MPTIKSSDLAHLFGGSRRVPDDIRENAPQNLSQPTPLDDWRAYDWAGYAQQVEQRILNRLGRRGFFKTVVFTAGAIESSVRPEEERFYFYIQNVSPAANFLVGFGTTPFDNNSLFLGPDDWFEPRFAPTNEIRVIRAGPVDAQGVMFYVGES